MLPTKDLPARRKRPVIAGANENPISPGPLQERAASATTHFDALTEDAETRAPLHRPATIAAAGATASGIVPDLARSLTGTGTGNTARIDGGHHGV
ncbi:MAG: SDR family oxidoreductase [Pseudomonadota bacterium]